MTALLLTTGPGGPEGPQSRDNRAPGIDPRPVRDFRVDTVEILEQDYYRLPAAARQLIEAYAEPRPAPSGWMRFRIVIYRWEEIDRALGEGRIKGLRGSGASQ